MLATDVMIRHHRKLHGLFEQYRRLARRGDRGKKATFELLQRTIRLHLALEEELLFPATTRTPSPEAALDLDGALQEHQEIGELLDSLSRSQPGKPLFESRMRLLERRIRGHLQLEKAGPYEMVLEVLNEGELESLGAQISARITLLSQTPVCLS
jgi:hypothetical protein